MKKIIKYFMQSKVAKYRSDVRAAEIFLEFNEGKYDSKKLGMSVEPYEVCFFHNFQVCTEMKKLMVRHQEFINKWAF